jgi:hypothetical protein
MSFSFHSGAIMEGACRYLNALDLVCVSYWDSVAGDKLERCRRGISPEKRVEELHPGVASRER